jgi:hypothetical protein
MICLLSSGSLAKADFSRILRDNSSFADAIKKVAKDRYRVDVTTESLAAD